MKKNLQGLIAIPAVILFVTTVIPLVIATLISMKDYSPFKGVLGSPLAPDGGLLYYLSFLRDPFFTRLFMNSLLRGFVPIIFSSLISFLLVYCLLKITSKAVRYSLLGFVALTAFTPVALFALGMTKMITVNSFLSSLAFDFLNALPMVFISTMIGVVVCERLGSSTKNMTYGIGFIAILWGVTLFSSNTESILMAYEPMNYLYMDTFRTYIYQTAISEGDFPLSAAVDMMLVVLQLCLAVGAFFAMSAIIPKLMTPPSGGMDTNKPVSSEKNILAIGFGAFIALLVSIPLLFVLFDSLTSSAGVSSNTERHIVELIASNFIHSILVLIISSIIFVPTTLILAYSLHGGNKIMRGLLLLLMACSPLLGQFITIKNFGMLDTDLSVAFFGSVSIFSAFILYLWVEAKTKGKILRFGQYCIEALIPLLVVTMLYIAATYGSYFEPMIYIRDMNKVGISVLLKGLCDQVIFEITDRVPIVALIVTMAIPVVLAICAVVALYFDGRKKPAQTVAPTYYSYMQ